MNLILVFHRLFQVSSYLLYRYLNPRPLDDRSDQQSRYHNYVGSYEPDHPTNQDLSSHHMSIGMMASKVTTVAFPIPVMVPFPELSRVIAGISLAIFKVGPNA